MYQYFNLALKSPNRKQGLLVRLNVGIWQSFESMKIRTRTSSDVLTDVEAAVSVLQLVLTSRGRERDALLGHMEQTKFLRKTIACVEPQRSVQSRELSDCQ